jgi:hypothetical protein
MDSLAPAAHDGAVRVLPHIKRLDDRFSDFLVRVVCPCGTSRHIQPQALARLVGWKMTLRELALRMRCSSCGKKVAGVVAVARPRPRGIAKDQRKRRPRGGALRALLDRVSVRVCAGKVPH